MLFNFNFLTSEQLPIGYRKISEFHKCLRTISSEQCPNNIIRTMSEQYHPNNVRTNPNNVRTAFIYRIQTSVLYFFFNFNFLTSEQLLVPPNNIIRTMSERLLYIEFKPQFYNFNIFLNI